MLKISARVPRLAKKIGLLLLFCTAIRILPYFAPIRARDIRQNGQAMEFIDRHGLPLGTILTKDKEHTALIEFKKVSPHFIEAILAAEDSSFYYHGPLDVKAIARSLLQWIETKRIQSGASTITMQLARMLEPNPRTFTAKLQEIWLSWRLAAGMNKKEILEAYINRLPMGSNIYGVEAAARVYFGVAASQLNLAQATLLAGLPNNPTYLNPYHYWGAAKKRQLYVIKRLIVEGYINQQQGEDIYQEKITLQSRQQGIIAAPHFLFWLAHNLPPVSSSSPIRTTIDYSLQKFVEAQVKQTVATLESKNVHHGAAIIIDNHTGEVLAYVGSPDYFDENNQGKNDGVQALRQPGSTLKPFLYQLALEKRLIRPNTILADVPTNYAIPGGKVYAPTDYNETYQGPVTVRIALANSLNVPAVKVLEKVGVANFLQRLHQLGFTNLNQTDTYYGLGLALGSGEVSLWELARAYLTIARGGNSIDLVTTVTEKGNQKNKSSSTWELIRNILSDRYARAHAFGVESVLGLPFSTAVKTGTSSNFRDTWTIGFSSDYTVATWVGNFSGASMEKVNGVTGAAPLWHRIMAHLHRHEEPESFAPPQGMREKPICALSGFKPIPACPKIVREYFYPEDLVVYESTKDPFYQINSQGKYQFNLPQEYNRYLVNQSQLSPGFKIIFPQNKSSFIWFDSRDGQQLKFQVTGDNNTPKEWWLNGEKIATNSDNYLFWQLQPGKWNLEVRAGEKTDLVTFAVEESITKNMRRGFSTMKRKSDR